MASVEKRPVAVITGTTRDVGEFTALGLAHAGWDIVGIYKNPQHAGDQNAISDRIGTYRGTLVSIEGDITDPKTALMVKDLVSAEFDGRINALVLNAAGGFGRSVEESRAINVDAQLRMVDTLYDNLALGSIVVFNTSDPAHREHLIEQSGQNAEEVLGAYYPVAKAKNEVEQMLRGRIPDLENRGSRLAVIVGNALEGTFVTKILQRRFKDILADWQQKTPAGFFPTAMDMAAAVTQVVRGNFPTGYTEYVGVKLSDQLYPTVRQLGERLFGPPPMREGSMLSREDIYGIIPHRWPFMFLGSVSEIEFGKRAVGELVDMTTLDINWREGHFPSYPVVPGAITQEALAQLGALTVLGMEENRGKIALLTGVNLNFVGQISPGEPARLEIELTEFVKRRGKGVGRAFNAAGKTALEGEISFGLISNRAS